MLFLFWTKRHTLRQWATSLRMEVSRGRFDRARFQTLVHALYKLSTDDRVANSPKVRSLRVVGDLVEVDADMHWNQLPALRTALAQVPAISRVDLVGSAAPGAPAHRVGDDVGDLLASGVASGG